MASAMQQSAVLSSEPAVAFAGDFSKASVLAEVHSSVAMSHASDNIGDQASHFDMNDEDTVSQMTVVVLGLCTVALMSVGSYQILKDYEKADARIRAPPANGEIVAAKLKGGKQGGYTMKFIAFFSLVVIQGAHLLFFRLSQTGGRYHYNTASAIAVTELIKLTLASLMWFSGNERKWPPLSIVLSYSICACAYAVNNQLAMFLLTHMGTGMLQLGKSICPMLTAVSMWVFYADERFHRIQALCFFILTMGLIVLFSPNLSGGKNHIQPLALAWLILSVFITALTSVFNARVLQKGRCSLHMQNMCLYSQGFVVNMLLYLTGLNASGGTPSGSFFDGYNNAFVIAVLFSQSFMGIIMSAVYKYGDAIIKCLASSVQACILLIFDSMLFGYSLSITSVAGAGVVMSVTYMYFAEALPAAKALKEAQVVRAIPAGEENAHLIEKDVPLSKNLELSEPKWRKMSRFGVGLTMATGMVGVGGYVLSFYV
uniref:UDP-galactose transporter n=1 Tax=Lotharella oceanica TaxID=641309 RepID=A0A7S2X9V3_9EUKA